MAVPPDSYQISVNIIEAVKEHPVLYCTEVKGEPVKLQEFKQQVWKYVCDQLGLDSTWVRLKWKNLRDTYSRILKCKIKADEGVRRKRWIFEDLLSFLKFPCETDYEPQCVELTKEYVELINSKDLTAEGLLEQLEDRTEDYSEFLEVLEETSADPVILEPVEETVETIETIETLETIETAEILDDSNEQTVAQEVVIVQEIPTEDVNNINQKRSKIRKTGTKRLKTRNTSLVLPSYRRTTRSSSKIDNLNVNDITAIDVPSSIPFNIVSPGIPFMTVKEAKNMEKENGKQKFYLAPESKGIELFFDSMAQAVKKLPSKAQADIKLNICKLVTEAEIKYCGPTTVQSAQQFLTPPGMIPKLILIPCNMLDDPNDKN
ncbi:hypothetical protein ALC62_09441 [Cyphomyrmex costatus]|uniref:MADF domain-containing protein n=1 Tax=Cyphomyrmex costatus TaxID=456900 RepID=A0A195CID1_9HYME|nr:hypothetical protein ALC62_09441 [Cyphomyrmex costatus]